jgi:hypothetical protein
MLSIESSRGLIKNRTTLYQILKIVSYLRILIKNKFKYLGYLKIRNVQRAFIKYLQKIVFKKMK